MQEDSRYITKLPNNQLHTQERDEGKDFQGRISREFLSKKTLVRKTLGYFSTSGFLPDMGLGTNENTVVTQNGFLTLRVCY
jgi:hypothetical protein